MRNFVESLAVGVTFNGVPRVTANGAHESIEHPHEARGLGVARHGNGPHGSRTVTRTPVRRSDLEAPRHSDRDTPRQYLSLRDLRKRSPSAAYSVRLYFLAGRVEGDLSGPERLGPVTWRDDDHEEV